MKPLTPARIRAAWIIALTTDALQIGLMPITGTLSTWVDWPLDVLAAALLWRLLGWHFLLLPSFVVELVPYVQTAPTWTLAVWYLTRQRPVLSNSENPSSDQKPVSGDQPFLK